MSLPVFLSGIMSFFVLFCSVLFCHAAHCTISLSLTDNFVPNVSENGHFHSVLCLFSTRFCVSFFLFFSNLVLAHFRTILTDQTLLLRLVKLTSAYQRLILMETASFLIRFPLNLFFFDTFLPEFVPFLFCFVLFCLPVWQIFCCCC